MDPIINKNIYGITYSTDKIIESSTDTDYGLSESELDIIINHIEKNRFDWFKEITESSQGFMYLRKENTGLPRTLLITENEGIFIHLKRKNIKQIGSGKASRVTVSIKYSIKSKEKLEETANAVNNYQYNFGNLKSFNASYAQHKKIYQRLKDMNIEGVVKIYYYHDYIGKKGSHKLSLLMEMCNKGTLEYLITSGKLSASEEKKRISEQICVIIAKLHQAEITHGDLAPVNILFQSEALNVKLIDFGDGEFLEGMSEFEKIGHKMKDIHLLGQVLYCICAEKTSRGEQQKDFEEFVERIMGSDSKELKPIENLILDLMFPIKLEKLYRVLALVDSKNQLDQEEAQKQYCELLRNISMENFLNRLNDIPASYFNIT